MEELIRVNLRFSRSKVLYVMLMVLFCVDGKNCVVMMSTDC